MDIGIRVLGGVGLRGMAAVAVGRHRAQRRHGRDLAPRAARQNHDRKDTP